MPDFIREILEGMRNPVTILANSPLSRESEAEDALRDYISGIGFLGNCDVLFLRDADGAWENNTIEKVDSENGVMVVHVDFNECLDHFSWEFQIATFFDSDQVKALRGSKNMGARLHAQCMMMADATEPLDAVEVDSDEEADSLLKPSEEVMNEICMLDASHCLFSSEKLAVYLFKGREAPLVMQLIGMARAVAFTAIGAGSGKAVDVSDEDEYYDHLLLWDKTKGCLVGAYRLGFTEEILKTRGVDGLYLNHVFLMEQSFYDMLGNSMELSRSFVLPCYQKNPQMLDALWKGIGLAAVAKNCYTLYGSVTISASYTQLSQSILVDTLDRFYSGETELRNCVMAKCPYEPQTEHHTLVSDAWSSLGLNKLNGVIKELEHDQRSIPPLIRYYVGLGAKFLSFQVEESFNNAIYCLLKVDLKSLPRRYKKRFLGGAELEEKR